MKNKTKITEEEKFKIHVDDKTLSDPNQTKKLAMLKRKNPNIEFDLEPAGLANKTSSMSTVMEEPKAIIEPQDQATIKYLSNVIDNSTGEVSQPFTIADKNYQMIRGMHSNGNVVMAVMCLEDSNIYEVDRFEKEIALPMKEKLEMESNQPKEDTYEGYKHYLVNKKTNEVRKFKTIEEMLSCNKMEEEEYMSRPKFKQYTNERLFGSSKRKSEVLNEVTPTGEESDEEMNIKAKKLMDMIMKRIPQNIIDTIKTPIAQREVIAAFAEMIGVPRTGLSSLISGLKDISKQQVTNENKIMTKNQLLESFGLKKKVIKTIKVKDIK
jgi:hypothetical protein